MRSRAERRWNREVKARRRIKEDRAQHGPESACPCKGHQDPCVWGRTFARFADTPKRCSCWACGNPRRYGKSGERLRLHERRADDSYHQQLADPQLDVDDESCDPPEAAA